MSESTSEKRRSTPLRILKAVLIIGLVLAPTALAYQALKVSYMNALSREPVVIARVLDQTPMPVFMILPFKDMWNEARAGRLGKGDLAPDFTLARESGGEPVTLSSFRDQRPVVLVFGSYT